jgi:colanic acid/amylovoran biosynthesis glycosyltransferase
VVPEWLPRSETFVFTALRNQRRHRPIVLADRITQLEAFPIEPVIELLPAHATITRRLADRVRAYSMGLPASYDLRIVQAARAYDCELMHAHFGPTACGVLGARAKLGIPLVTTFYGYDLAFARERPDWAPRYERLFREGARFVCEGPAMAAHLASLGCPADRIRIVKIGVDLEQFPFTPRTPARPLIFAATGRFVPKKGFDLALRAFAAARPSVGDSQLWLIGDGPERARLERLSAELAVAEHVVFHGMVSYGDYQELMRRAHVALQPSRTAPDGDTEGGAPTVIIEMQATGVPVISTQHADIPSVVARPGELVPENDVEALAGALVEVASLTAGEWLERAREARALMEGEHDARITASALEAVYDEALRTA